MSSNLWYIRSYLHVFSWIILSHVSFKYFSFAPSIALLSSLFCILHSRLQWCFWFSFFLLSFPAFLVLCKVSYILSIFSTLLFSVSILFFIFFHSVSHFHVGRQVAIISVLHYFHFLDFIHYTLISFYLSSLFSSILPLFHFYAIVLYMLYSTSHIFLYIKTTFNKAQSAVYFLWKVNLKH